MIRARILLALTAIGLTVGLSIGAAAPAAAASTETTVTSTDSGWCWRDFCLMSAPA